MNIPFIIVILYVVLLLGISAVISKKSKESKEDFLLYKGKNNTSITAVTISGLLIGGAFTIWIAENAFTVGLSAGWYNVAWAFGAVIASTFIIKKFRKAGYSTVTKLVESIYDEKTCISYDIDSMHNYSASIYSRWVNTC